MTNKEIIEKLNKIGKLPSGSEYIQTNFPLKEFLNLIQAFVSPVDFETALQLVNFSPPVNESCCEVEWSLVHLVEEIDSDELQRVLDNADEGEVKRILQRRLDNHNKRKYKNNV